MNQDKLQQLRIQSEAKSRSSGTLWLIYTGVALITGIAIFFAWPRASDKIRIVGHKADGKKSAATSGATSAASGDTRAPAASNAPAPASLAVAGSLLTASGYIVNRERIELSPRFMGVVKWIGVKKGDAVTNGQVVVLLDDAEYRARLHETEGRLATMRVAVAKAELDYDRAGKLVASQVEMQKTADDARLQLESARASFREVEGQVELIRTYLEWTVIKSPIDGVVLEKLVDPNELVTPQSFGGTRGPSTALISVADLHDLQVEVELNESDLGKVFLNQPCQVSPVAYPGKNYSGYVAEVAPEANRQKGTLQVKVQIRNRDHFLTPELSAQVDFLGTNTPAVK